MSLQIPTEEKDGPLIPAGAIATRVSEMAAEISADYAGSELMLAIILRGAFIFAGDLVRRMDPALSVSLDFVAASSYRDRRTSSGTVRLIKDIELPVKDRDVLIVEDIVESGRTLHAVLDSIRARQPASVRIVTLLYKEGKLVRPVQLDYVGFRIPDVFVIGYGLDFAERYRNLPDIRVLEG